ncbi:unnamed protein product (mitochondrion) [Plasmodiophora brassicae]|uniref:Uncharacterized protein n=1 Tax=Plasmodiophora brassicae TaxID=37360 RepID=A0A3P3YLP2_PLABS|nr:unnamed protein product [Plasmodiophora brassicae]
MGVPARAESCRRVEFNNENGLRRCIAEGAGQDVFDENLTGGFVEYLLGKDSLKSFSAVSQYFQGARAVLRCDFFGCDPDTMCSDASKKKVTRRIQKVIVDRKIAMGCKLTNPAEFISREEYDRLAKAMLTMNTPESIDFCVCLVIARHLCCRMGDVGAMSLPHMDPFSDGMMCAGERVSTQKLATMCDRDVFLDAAVAMGVKVLVHGGCVQTLLQGKANAASHVTGQLKKVGVMTPEFGDHLDCLPLVPPDNRKSHLSRKSTVADMDAAGVS